MAGLGDLAQAAETREQIAARMSRGVVSQTQPQPSSGGTSFWTIFGAVLLALAVQMAYVEVRYRLAVRDMERQVEQAQVEMERALRGMD